MLGLLTLLLVSSAFAISTLRGDPPVYSVGLSSDESKAVFKIVDDLVGDHFLVLNGNYYSKAPQAGSEIDYTEFKSVGYRIASPDPTVTFPPNQGFKSALVFVMNCGDRTARLGIGSLGAGLPFKWSDWEHVVVPNSDLGNCNPRDVLHLIEVLQPKNETGQVVSPVWYIGQPGLTALEYFRIKPTAKELPKSP